ncbi:MAG: sodium:solute symporter family protein, partial [Thiohalobacterales bacterium]|nr:sodium:solute symporter family protein [Thiohalobacterales bacterium]
MLAAMDIYTGAILISLLVYIAVGNYAGRRVRHLDDYFVAGRQAPTLLIVGTLVASLFSTTAFLGEAGFAYAGQAGPFLLWPPIGAMGYIYGALFFGRYLRRSRALTVADYFGQRFNSRRVQAAAGVTIILGLGGYLLVVTQGAALLLSQLTPLTYLQGLVVAWISYTLFTMYSGSRGVILTDTLMFLLFASVTIAVLFYLVNEQGGWTETFRGLSSLGEKPDLMAWHGVVGPDTPFETALDYLAFGITFAVAWSLVYAISPWQSSRYLIARNEQVVMRAACFAAIAAVTMELTIYGTGAVVNLGKADIEPYEEAMIWAALNMMPEILGALLLAGIMAAALSSASTFLSLVGFSVSNDLFEPKSKDEAKRLRFSRLTMLAIGLITLAVSLVVEPDIFWLTYFVGTLYASSWGPVAFMSVWSDRITADGAFWGIVSGFVFNAGPRALESLGWIDLPSWSEPLLLGGVVSLLVTILVSRFGEVSSEERRYRQLLHQVPAEELDNMQLRNTLLAPIALIGFGIFVAIVLIRIYVRPYQEANGKLLP